MREETTRYGRMVAAWRRAIAALFAVALAAAPVLAAAQAGGTPGGGAAGGGPGGVPPGGAPGGGSSAAGSGRAGLAWIIVILAIALAIWLFTRRRGGTVHR